MASKSPDETHVREAAYFLWLEEGQPHGRDRDHWHKAVDGLTPAKPARKPRAAKPKAAPKATAAAKPAPKAETAAKPGIRAAAKPKAKSASAAKAPKSKAAKSSAS